MRSSSPKVGVFDVFLDEISRARNHPVGSLQLTVERACVSCHYVRRDARDPPSSVLHNVLMESVILSALVSSSAIPEIAVLRDTIRGLRGTGHISQPSVLTVDLRCTGTTTRTSSLRWAWKKLLLKCILPASLFNLTCVCCLTVMILRTTRGQSWKLL